MPPVSGGLTPVFHRYYDEPDPETRPAFLPRSRDVLSPSAQGSTGGGPARPRHLAGAAAELRHTPLPVAPRDRTVTS